MRNPNEILKSITSDDRQLLNAILEIEKGHLHEVKIIPNSQIEKSIIKKIMQVVDGAIDNED